MFTKVLKTRSIFKFISVINGTWGKNCSEKVDAKHFVSAAIKVKLPKMVSERISIYVRPSSYKLHLKPNLTSGIFEGKVEINVSIDKDAKDYIALHTKSLSISQVRVFKKSIEIPVSKLLEEKEIEQLVIKFNQPLLCGSYGIHIDFSGDLTCNIVGFYMSTISSERKMVASKFQPTYARQAFPCFDEPSFKAKFDISLEKPINYVALSNMPEISKTANNDSKTEIVHFASSVPMSTYLAVFVVCDFLYKETEINAHGIGNNFVLRSYSQKDQMHKIDFAQDIGKRSTEFYIKYYDVPFPLPKLDMIAIPDYISGATEHWGLITYRETSFLVDEATASAKNKIAVANTIAHELAHMWFGNLVTMEWWDEIWLNEGFASYMQVKALNAIEPSWTMLDQFLIKTMHSVLVTDAKLSSHPIVQTVETPDQITAIFDAISYNKGSSVLRMLEGFIGEENFRRGISDYLKKYAFKNTVQQNLLEQLEKYFNPNLNLTRIMDTWTRQMGYPLLKVEHGQKANTFVITQSRFLLDASAKYNETDSQFKYRWFVPITYKTNKGVQNNITWFPDTAEQVTIELTSADEWIKINNNQIGYYRVNYPIDVWNKLMKQLEDNHEMFTISDRSQLLNDAFALAESQKISYDLALNLTRYLRREKDYVPWETAAQLLGALYKKLNSLPSSHNLQKYIQHLIEPLYEAQSWEKTNNGIIKSLLRTRILSLAAQFEHPKATEEVKRMFLAYLNNGSQVETELRDVVYFYGMKASGGEEWEKLWELNLKEEDAQEKAKLRRALSAPKNAALLQKYLKLAWDENNIRTQDFLNVLSFISDNPLGTSLVWDEVKSRWPELVDRFTLNSRYLGNLIPDITSSFHTVEELDEMENFFRLHPEAGAGETARRRALENVRNNIKWANTHHSTVDAWLNETIHKLQ